MSHGQLIKVSLSRHRVRGSGKVYGYWCLRWFGSDGRQRGHSIGRLDGANKISKRQAELIRSRKEHEINQNPGRRDIGRAYKLGTFLDNYLALRANELAPGTLELHKLTARYLSAYFGENQPISRITRASARAFKAALANGDLTGSKRQRGTPKPLTVERSIREARTMFNQALQDDLVLSNPFDKLSRTIRTKKEWDYIGMDKFGRLLNACPNNSWQLLLALCRFAGLRQGEALNLTWREVDWGKTHLEIWGQKTKRTRHVPIGPELFSMLRDAFENAREGDSLVVTNLSESNLWRDFRVILKRAEIEPYPKWCQTLRRNREQDWNEKFPSHIVAAWMGHSESVAREHYLRVHERDMDVAIKTPIDSEFAQKLAQLGQKKSVDRKGKNGIVLEEKKI